MAEQNSLNPITTGLVAILAVVVLEVFGMGATSDMAHVLTNTNVSPVHAGSTSTNATSFQDTKKPELPDLHSMTSVSTNKVIQEFKPNDALVRSQQLIATPNIKIETEPESELDPQFYSNIIAAARIAREKKFYDTATSNLVGVLKSDAPDELKKTAILELSVVAYEQGDLPRAIQILSQFFSLFPKDPSIPEILLRQGIFYRQMGAYTLALTKFYAVMTAALNIPEGSLDYYKRLVLQAQTEIADTYYIQNRYSDAVEYYARLLKQSDPALNKSQIQYKLIKSFSFLGKNNELITQAEDFLRNFSGIKEEPEVRFLYSMALKNVGRTRESLEQVMQLLLSQKQKAAQDPATWLYWQKRTGNEIANQLYQEGDYIHAIEIYKALAELDNSLSWRLPVWYQIGLACEKLHQHQKAIEAYDLVITNAGNIVATNLDALKMVVDMARWRKEFLIWTTNTENTINDIKRQQPLAMVTNKMSLVP